MTSEHRDFLSHPLREFLYPLEMNSSAKKLSMKNDLDTQRRSGRDLLLTINEIFFTDVGSYISKPTGCSKSPGERKLCYLSYQSERPQHSFLYNDSMPCEVLLRYNLMYNKCSKRLAISINTRLNHHIPDRWIGRGGSIRWAPCSPDLTPLDFSCEIM